MRERGPGLENADGPVDDLAEFEVDPAAARQPDVAGHGVVGED
jgi:hypothetical protein